MRIIKYSVAALLVLYMQILIAPKFEILGIVPFFILPFVIFISMKLRFIEAVIIVFIMGLAIDILDTYILGANTALLLIVSHLVNRYHTSVTKDKAGPVMISVLMLNLLYFVPYIFIKSIIYGFNSGLFTLFPLELIYNSITTITFIILLTILFKIRVYLDV
jgi:rod shape-determining protein MreD